MFFVIIQLIGPLIGLAIISLAFVALFWPKYKCLLAQEGQPCSVTRSLCRDKSKPGRLLCCGGKWVRPGIDWDGVSECPDDCFSAPVPLGEAGSCLTCNNDACDDKVCVNDDGEKIDDLTECKKLKKFGWHIWEKGTSKIKYVPGSTPDAGNDGREPGDPCDTSGVCLGHNSFWIGKKNNVVCCSGLENQYDNRYGTCVVLGDTENTASIKGTNATVQNILKQVGVPDTSVGGEVWMCKDDVAAIATAATFAGETWDSVTDFTKDSLAKSDEWVSDTADKVGNWVVPTGATSTTTGSAEVSAVEYAENVLKSCPTGYVYDPIKNRCWKCDSGYTPDISKLVTDSKKCYKTESKWPFNRVYKKARRVMPS